MQDGNAKRRATREPIAGLERLEALDPQDAPQYRPSCGRSKRSIPTGPCKRTQQPGPFHKHRNALEENRWIKLHIPRTLAARVQQNAEPGDPVSAAWQGKSPDARRQLHIADYLQDSADDKRLVHRKRKNLLPLHQSHCSPRKSVRLKSRRAFVIRLSAKMGKPQNL